MLETDDLSDVTKLISDIQHGKLYSSYDIALITELLLEKLISKGSWKHAQELMELIKVRMNRIREALPQEVTITNIMRHLLKVIRDEYESGSKKGEGQSLHQLVTANLNDTLDYSGEHTGLKSSLLTHLTEYKVEIESSIDNIAAQASEHIHTNEIILTCGRSRTVEKFLKLAAKTRSFQVIVVESAPRYDGHELAASLAKSNIETTLIADTAVFAMMSRVNKVIIGTHTVMANGGLRATSGVNAIALAAKYCSVPVIILAHMFKLTPVYLGSHDQDTFNICASPAEVIPYSIGPLLNRIDVYNPIFDYVPPELITLFISHQGGNAPSYVYRLLSELYHPDDYDL